MEPKPADRETHTLRSPARTLREACKSLGLDRGGLRCTRCTVRELCHDDERWLVPMTHGSEPA